MKRSILFLSFLLLACNPNEEKFADFLDRYQEASWEQFPDWASSIGKQKYHSTLVIPSATKRQQDFLFCQNYLDSLQQFNPKKYNLELQEKHLALQEQLEGYIQQLTNDSTFIKDPAFYNVLGPFQHVLKDTSLPLDQRLRLLYHKMKTIPQYYETAINNLQIPTQTKTQQAIKDHRATFLFFHQTIRDSLKYSTLETPEVKQFLQRNNRSKDAIKKYAAFCNSIDFEFRALE